MEITLLKIAPLLERGGFGGLRRELKLIALVSSGARAPLAAQLAGVTINTARKMYAMVNGHASPSGQLPWAPGLETGIQRAEATVFLRPWLLLEADDPAVRLAAAYQKYLIERRRLGLRGKAFSFDRCHRVAQGFGTIKGQAGVVDRDNFMAWIRCKKCGQDALSSAYSPICPWCAGAIKASACRRERTGRKKKVTLPKENQ